MYCVKCGVELADGQRKCPLCETPVYYPQGQEDAERPYPDFESRAEKVNPRGIYFIISFVFLIAAGISLACDLNINGVVNWAGYVVGGLALGYISIVLPGWFNRPNPAVFVPCGFLGAAVYIWYISYTVGGDWFFTFALPLVAFFALVVCSIVILSYYIKRGYLYIWGGAFIASGIFSMVIEWMTNITFGLPVGIVWGLYPAIALSLIGIMLIVVAIVRPFRESLCRIFSI